MYTTIVVIFSSTQSIHARLRSRRGLRYSAWNELVQRLCPDDEGRAHDPTTLSALPSSSADNAAAAATSYLEGDGGLTGMPLGGSRTGSTESLQ